MVLLSEARRAIGQARSIDELKHIRDKAEAIRQYAKARGESLAIQNDAAEIKLRAERRAGDLLRDRDVARPGGDRKSKSRDVTLKLENVGVTRSESHRWQREADVSEEDFERFVSETKDAGAEVTTAGLLRVYKLKNLRGRNDNLSAIGRRQVASLHELIGAGAHFGTIYADPPWQYGNQGTRAATDNHYPTMRPEEIAALPVAQLIAPNAHLHLWTTNAFLFESKAIIEAWGFEYKSCLVWVKPQMGIGNYWRVSHEFLLLGVRGQCAFTDHTHMSWVNAERGKHSAKPPIVREKIEKVSPGPRLELFGRGTHPGWTVWGNEVDGPMFAGATA